MTISNILNIIGLVFDLIGVIMLFMYGLPPEVSRTGAIYLIAEQDNPEEIARAKKLKCLSYIALISIILGFFLQIAANIVPALQ